MIRIRAKICGLTNEADARAALAAGADALGFNFWPGSKRFVEPAEALPWIAALPARVTRVAVMVDPDFSTALRGLETPGIDALQLHGDETPEFCARLAAAGHRLIKAIRVHGDASLVTRTPENYTIARSWATSFATQSWSKLTPSAFASSSRAA